MTKEEYLNECIPEEEITKDFYNAIEDFKERYEHSTDLEEKIGMLIEIEKLCLKRWF